MNQNADSLRQTRRRGRQERVGKAIRLKGSVSTEAEIQRKSTARRVIEGEASDEDIVEEEIGVGESGAEEAGLVDAVELGELVGELGNRCEVVVVAVEDDLGVGLVELGEIGGLVD